MWLGTDVSKLHIGLITQQTEELGYLLTRSIGMKQTRKMYNFGVRLFVVSKQFYAACTKGSFYGVKGQKYGHEAATGARVLERVHNARFWRDDIQRGQPFIVPSVFKAGDT